jgi:hypothetical protein
VLAPLDERAAGRRPVACTVLPGVAGAVQKRMLYSRPMPPDRRDDDRVPILGELHGEIMVFQPMQVREIGCQGVTVETRAPLHIDSLHELRLTLGERSVIVKGRIVHCRISDVDQDVVTYRSGLEFVEMSRRVTDAIAVFLDAMKAGRSGL